MACQMWRMRVLVLAVVLCGGVPWGAVCAPAANPIDAAAMQAIAKSTGWGVKSSDPCDGTWAGVSCNDDGRITSIVASHADLNGYLNGSDLSKLTFLSNLDVSLNGLSGRLPVLPTPLQYLRAVNFGSNSFNGVPPDGFYAGLPALETIVLDNNRLLYAWSEQRDIPSSRLQSFSANNVSTYVGFPNFFGNITLFPDLERLSLARNQIWGSVRKGFGAKIRYLDISGQTGSGDDRVNGRMLFIPGMANLVEAHLDHYGFSGPLPDATQLVNLRVFDASYNDLCGDPKFPPGTVVDLTGNPRVGQGCAVYV